MPFKTTVNWLFNDICYLVIINIYTIIINLFSVDQLNRIHNHSIYVKTIAIIEDKC